MSVANLQNLVSYLSFGSIFLLPLFGILMWLWHDKNYAQLRQPRVHLIALLVIMLLAAAAAAASPWAVRSVVEVAGESLADDEKMNRLVWQALIAGFFVFVVVLSFVYAAFNRTGHPVVKTA